MYKFLFIMLVPLFVCAKSGILTHIIDGDSVVLKDGVTNVVCHLGDLDTPEIRVNTKLKREMKQCQFSKNEFIGAGNLSLKHAKTILKIGKKYEYTIPRYLPSKNPVCYLKITKGLHIELHPHFDQLMVSHGYALPYIIHSTPKYTKMLLSITKEAKEQKKGLWKTHSDLMQCLVKHRYSLRSLR